MSERKYTVREIDELRQVIERKYLYGSYAPKLGGGISRSFKSSEKDALVEDRLRTHILSGHTAEDLLASEQPK